MTTTEKWIIGLLIINIAVNCFNIYSKRLIKLTLNLDPAIGSIESATVMDGVLLKGASE